MKSLKAEKERKIFLKAQKLKKEKKKKAKQNVWTFSLDASIPATDKTVTA